MKSKTSFYVGRRLISCITREESCYKVTLPSKLSYLFFNYTEAHRACARHAQEIARSERKEKIKRVWNDGYYKEIEYYGAYDDVPDYEIWTAKNPA